MGTKIIVGFLLFVWNIEDLPNLPFFYSQIVLILVCIQGTFADSKEDAKPLYYEGPESGDTNNIYLTHSCIHDEILHQRRRTGRKEYSVTPQVYVGSTSSEDHHRGRTLLSLPEEVQTQSSAKQPIRIYLNYDAVGHSADRDCQKVGDIVKVLVEFIVSLLKPH